MPNSRKCPMCRSRDVIVIEKPKERPYKLDSGEEMIIYPTTKCLRCGAEFDFRRKSRNF